MLPQGGKNYKIIRLHTWLLQIATNIAISVAAFSVNAAEWKISRLDKEVTVGAPVVRFDFDGAFSGSTGCNSFLGKAQFAGQHLVIDKPVATTRMACDGDALTAQDDAIIALFTGRVSVAFDPLRSILRLSNDETAIELTQILNFGPSIPDTHGGLERPIGAPHYLSVFGMTGQISIRREPSIDAGILGVINSGTLLRNAGCVEKVGLSWCEVATVDEMLTGWTEGGSLEPADNVVRAGKSVYDAAGLVPCAVGLGAPMAQCTFGVARDKGGSATVVVTKPDGVERILFFAEGAFLSPDTSEAGGGFDHSVSREGDLTLIRVEHERYEIPDAVIFGG